MRRDMPNGRPRHSARRPEPTGDESIAPRGGARTRTRLAAGLMAALLVGTLGCSGQADTASAGSSAARSTTTTRTFPRSARVDLLTSTFSHPTKITNPLFPIKLRQVIQLGHAADKSLHQEVTRLPYTKVIQFHGRGVETVVSQFVAYEQDRILEVAVDYFAQADDGSVWYFGEDVSTYEKGVVASHEGTWRAGKDGPPGMIMPAHPHVGDVYRPENIPGLVFEEVIVKAVGVTVAGPRGPVGGSVLVEEHPMDGAIELKHFAPGYGEFLARVASEHEYVTAALANPTDALPGALPRELATLSTGATKVFQAAPSAKWDRVSATVDKMTAAWKQYRKGLVTKLLRDQVNSRLAHLHSAVGAHDVAATRQAALELSLATLDVELQYRSTTAVDRDRIEAWQHQLAVDRAAHHSGAAAGDLAVIKTIQQRIGR